MGYNLLTEFIENADHCRKFIRKLDGDLFISPVGLDPIEDFTLDWLFGRLMRIGGVDGEAIEYVNYKRRREFVDKLTIFVYFFSTRS